MKVFVSWSGERSKGVAKALSRWLPELFQDLTSWMSSDSISAGAQWETELKESLRESRFGVVCLTPENIAAPWLLFEAGAVSTAMAASRVVPYCFGMKPTEVTPPLSMFQASTADRDGTYLLIQSINQQRDEGRAMDELRLNRVFEKWWPDLESELQKISELRADTTNRRSDRDILEETLSMVRDIHDPNRMSFHYGWLYLNGSQKQVSKVVQVWKLMAGVAHASIDSQVPDEQNTVRVSVDFYRQSKIGVDELGLVATLFGCQIVGGTR